jgi:hypothetical protein
MPTKSKAAVLEEEAIEDQELEQEPEDFAGEAEETEEAPEDNAPIRLTGQKLLDFYAARKAAGYSHSDIAYDAGYYTVTKAGQGRVMVAQFNEAFLEAQGHDVGGKPAGAGRSHAGLNKARVSGQGILLVSQLATRHIGAEPGAVFSVEYPQGDFAGPGAQILLTLTDEVKPVVARKQKEEEEPGTPLLDQAA